MGGRMKYFNGVWYHQGQSYATLYEALAAVWPQALPSRAGKKGAAPGTANTGSGGVKKVLQQPCFTSEDTTGAEVLQG